MCVSTCWRQNERILKVMELQTMDNLKFSVLCIYLNVLVFFNKSTLMVCTCNKKKEDRNQSLRKYEDLGYRARRRMGQV